MPSSCAMSPQRSMKRESVESERRDSAACQPSPELFCERGPFDGGRRWNPRQPAIARTATAFRRRELAFLGDPFESLSRALDAVLAVVAIGRQQPDHLIGAGGGRTGNIAGSKIDESLQRGICASTPSPSRKERRPRSRSRCVGRPENPAVNLACERPLASSIRAWQMREFCSFFRVIAGTRSADIRWQPVRAQAVCGKLAVGAGMVDGLGSCCASTLAAGRPEC